MSIGHDFLRRAADSTFGTAIYGMAQAGFVSGYANGTFHPGSAATRGQAAKMPALAFGLPAASGTQHFIDVPPTHTFYTYIESAYEAGLISGYADGTFRPGSPVTRGQIAKMVVGAVEQIEPAGWEYIVPTAPTFTDVPVGSTYYRYIEEAYVNGVVSGYPDHTFRPSAQATRGQIAQIIMSAVTAQQAKYPNGVPDPPTK